MRGSSSKLTLALDATVIRRAKKYAQSRNKSVSQLVEDYFRTLTEDADETMPLPPVTKSLMGMLQGRPVPDMRQEMSHYLRKKFR